MIPLRKEHAGSCSFGYIWPKDGAVVEVEPDHAVALLAIPDGDYTAVDAAPEPEPADVTLEEPAPAPELSEAPPARKTAAKKTATKKETSAAPEPPAPVEE